jgi:HEAT repeat protein
MERRDAENQVAALANVRFSPRTVERGFFAAVTFALLCLAAVSTFADEKTDVAISKIIAQLKHKDPQVRLEAMIAIRTNYRSRATAAIPALLELLKGDTYQNDYLQVCNALTTIGPCSVPAVLTLLRSENATWRERAVVSLWHLSNNGVKMQAAIPELITRTRDKEKTVRSLSLGVLGKIGPASEDVVPAVASSLKDEEAAVRRAACHALAGFGRDAKLAIPMLVDLLQHNDTSTRAIAVFALGRIGPDATAATGELTQLLAHEVLREEASVALGRIGVDEADVPALIKVLNDNHVRSRQLAAFNLSRAGPDAKPAVAHLPGRFKTRSVENSRFTRWAESAQMRNRLSRNSSSC